MMNLGRLFVLVLLLALYGCSGSGGSDDLGSPTPLEQEEPAAGRRIPGTAACRGKQRHDSARPGN